MPKSYGKAAWRLRHYVKQDGKCYWCGGRMRMGWDGSIVGKLKKDHATIDHVHQRNDPKRLLERENGFVRKVQACYACTLRRQHEFEADLLRRKRLENTGTSGDLQPVEVSGVCLEARERPADPPRRAGEGRRWNRARRRFVGPTIASVASGLHLLDGTMVYGSLDSDPYPGIVGEDPGGV